MPRRENIPFPALGPVVPKGWRPFYTQTEIERRESRRLKSKLLWREFEEGGIFHPPLHFKPIAEFPDIDWEEMTSNLHRYGRAAVPMKNVPRVDMAWAVFGHECLQHHFRDRWRRLQRERGLI